MICKSWNHLRVHSRHSIKSSSKTVERGRLTLIRQCVSKFTEVSKESTSSFAVTQPQRSKVGPAWDSQHQKNSKYFSSEKLADGRVVNLRAIQPNDKPILIEGMHHLSKSSRYFRFFAHKEELTQEELSFLTEVDFAHHVALLATIVGADTEHPAGVGRYVIASTDAEVTAAELAFAVIDECRGLGVATLLLKHLIEIAKADGIEQLIASVLPENKAMQRVLYKSGLPITQTVNSVNVLEFTLRLK